MTDEHHWVGVKPDPGKYFGFVYIIRNLRNGREYIGKKQYWAVKPRSPKSRVTDRSSLKWKPQHWKESNWKTYTSSSKELNEDIKKIGKRFFEFEIVGQYSSKGSLHYGEVEWQVKFDTLTELLDGTDKRRYYNKQIAAVKFIPPRDMNKRNATNLKKLLAKKRRDANKGTSQ